MRKGYTFYYLQDPNTGEIGYVGMTTENPGQRLRRHITEARGGSHSENSDKNVWLRELFNTGVKPNIVELEYTQYKTLADAHAREKYWIARMKSEGHNLRNMTEGGAGTPGLSIEHTPESRQKIADAIAKDYDLEKAIALRKDGKSWQTIYTTLGMSRSNFYKLYKKQIEDALS